MFSIESLSLSSTGRKRTETMSISQTGGRRFSATAVAVAGLTRHSTSRRSPWDYLRQGGVMDKFGNKRVWHRTVDGSLAAIPTINDSSATYNIDVLNEYQWADYTRVPMVDGKALVNGQPLIIRCVDDYYSRVRASVYVAVGEALEDNVAIGSFSLTGRYKNAGQDAYMTIVLNKPNPDGYGVVVEQIEYVATLQNPSDRGYPTLAEAYDILTGINVDTWIDTLRLSCKTALLKKHTQRTKTYYTINSFSVPSVDYDLIYRKVVGPVIRAAESVKIPASDRSLQAREAIENLNHFDSNLLAYTADLRKTGDTIRELFRLVSNAKSPKAWASAYLSLRYGDRLMVSDTKELLQSLEKFLRSHPSVSKGTASSHFVNHVYHDILDISVVVDRKAIIYASNESYSRLMTDIYNLMRWDAWPTLENTWDLIPLSFVVDWFIPVQDLLGQIDACVEAPYIRAESQIVGLKRVARTSVNRLINFPYTGNLECRYYTRSENNVLGDVRPFDVVIEPPSFSITHLGDALALVTTTRGHR